MPPHLRVRLIDAEPEPFAPQWDGVLYLEPGDAAASGASNRFDVNTGDTSVAGWNERLPQDGIDCCLQWQRRRRVDQRGR